MKKIILALAILYSVQSFSQEYIPLWTADKMPNSRGIILPDSISNERIYRVGLPGMWVFLTSKQENKGGAVVIFPGGGYHHEAYNISGLQLAKWFNTFGISAFVLKYRLPNSVDLKDHSIAPLQDAQRALRIIRAYANSWGINPDKIGVLGTSSGGHLASTIGTHSEDVAAAGDSLDRYSYVPNFMILVSPVIDFGMKGYGFHKGLLGDNASEKMIAEYSNQLRVTSKTPPAFIVHAQNDNVVPVYHSLVFHKALLDSGISASLHIFPQGAHKIALRDNPGSTALWTELCEQWMKEMGFIETKH
ncbi:MAG: alpha/beta hydrolase [Bacteroidetes bacterium]|nr:alpha/beta hydrolase [Bacteroidota bacterium]